MDGTTLLEQFEAATNATDGLCNALAQVDDPPAEMAFLRVWASVCRVVHLLRAAVPELPPERLEFFMPSKLARLVVSSAARCRQTS